MCYFRKVKRTNLGWIFGLLMCLMLSTTTVANAQRFQLEHEDHSDSVIWFVRNTTNQWVKPTSITINWFHTKPDLYVWDAFAGPASYRNRIPEINKSGKYTFRYKSTQGVGINDTIYAGQRIPVFYSVNYNTTNTDTIMPANCIMFYHDSLVRDGEEIVVPKGASCDYKRVYINSFAEKSGVHFRSPVWFSLNRDVCQPYLKTTNLFVMVIFDQKTFMPTSAGVIPKCPSGRFGTAFGYPIDSQIYYSFTLSDKGHIDSIISGITDGDYVALASYPNFDRTAISKLKTAFAPIGLNTDSLIIGPDGSSDTQLVFWGRKGLSISNGRLNTKGRFNKGSGSIVNLTADQIMIKNQASDELAGYAPCFETVAIIHQPYIPAPIKVNTKALQTIQPIACRPNPAKTTIDLGISPADLQWQFFDATGRPVMSKTFQKMESAILNIEELSSGLYFGKASETRTISTLTTHQYRTQFIKID